MTQDEPYVAPLLIHSVPPAVSYVTMQNVSVRQILTGSQKYTGDEVPLYTAKGKERVVIPSFNVSAYPRFVRIDSERTLAGC